MKTVVKEEKDHDTNIEKQQKYHYEKEGFILFKTLYDS
jgi:hypothetical protein